MLQQTIAGGEELVTQDHYASDEIKTRINDGMAQWDNLEELAEQRKKKLEEANNLCQV